MMTPRFRNVAAREVQVQFGANISLLRNERLPKGPRFASESLDADTATARERGCANSIPKSLFPA